MTQESGSAPSRHVSVLAKEVLEYLQPSPGQILVDATTGAGGHTRLLAERVLPGGRLLALDRDDKMLAQTRERLGAFPITYVQANFADLQTVLDEQGLSRVDGVLADLGICSDQLDHADRGFSFQQEGPLDMRLDPSQGVDAATLVHTLSERDLADLIYQFGEERFSRRIARRIVEARDRQPLRTTLELAELVRRCLPRPKGYGKSRLDPATRVFQALRIAVNDELASLEQLLRSLPDLLNPGGRAVLISFHSLEDRLVKQAFKQAATWQVLTKKPIQASEEEATQNPRSRSAKLRAACRTLQEGA